MDNIKLLGAVSDTDETFFLPCEENFNSDTTIRLLDALQTEFGEKICKVNGSFHEDLFTANRVKSSLKILRSNCVLGAGFNDDEPRGKNAGDPAHQHSVTSVEVLPKSQRRKFVMLLSVHWTISTYQMSGRGGMSVSR